MNAGNAEKKTCFVISPIGKPDSDIRRNADMVLDVVIKSGLEGLGFEIQRADEMPSPGMITDKVIQAIMHSKLVVADLTDQNPNVFYELGLRHAARKPIIHLCDERTTIPFDTAGHSTIFYRVDDIHSLKRTAQDLRRQAGETQQSGFTVSNPVTQANAQFEMSHSSDTRDQVIAEMKSRMAATERTLDLVQSKLGSTTSARDTDRTHPHKLPTAPGPLLKAFLAQQMAAPPSDDESNWVDWKQSIDGSHAEDTEPEA